MELTPIILIIMIIIELIIVFGPLIGVTIVYGVTMLITLICIIAFGKKVNANFIQKVKCVIYNPIFLFSYIVCLISLVFRRKVKWDRTIHEGNK